MLRGPCDLKAALLPAQHAFLRYIFRYPGSRCGSYSRPSLAQNSSGGPLLRVDYRMAASKPTARLF